MILMTDSKEGQSSNLLFEGDAHLVSLRDTANIQNNTIQYNTIQRYCQVTNAQRMCNGTKHTHTHTHTSHIKKKL